MHGTKVVGARCEMTDTILNRHMSRVDERERQLLAEQWISLCLLQHERRDGLRQPANAKPATDEAKRIRSRQRCEVHALQPGRAFDLPELFRAIVSDRPRGDQHEQM